MPDDPFAAQQTPNIHDDQGDIITDETAVAISGQMRRPATLVQGADPTERDNFIRSQMDTTRFYLEQPDAVFDFNAHKRDIARRNHERKSETLRQRGQEPDPFDESQFPPVLHIKANTWLRLARRYDLDIQLVYHGWMPDPAWPEHRAFEVEAIALKDSREVGRSRQLCSFAETQGERRRWTDSTQVMATAETRARSRAIAQALQWAIPFAYHTATPEEMPALPSTTEEDRQPKRSAHPDTGANAPHLRAGKNVNPNYKGPIGNEPEPDPAPTQPAPPEQASVETQQESPPSQAPVAPAAAAEEPAEILWPYPLDEEKATALASENEAYAWAVTFYRNCVAHKLMPPLTTTEWQKTCGAIMEASSWSEREQADLVAKLQANATPTSPKPAQTWLFSLAKQDEGS